MWAGRLPQLQLSRSVWLASPVDGGRVESPLVHALALSLHVLWALAGSASRLLCVATVAALLPPLVLAAVRAG